MMKILMLLSILPLMLEGNVLELGCLLWRNSFVLIQKQKVTNSQEEFIFVIHSKQSKGWMSIGIFSKPNKFEDSITIVGYLPNNFLQLTNHTTEVKQKTIFGATFQNQLFNQIDGTFTFAFKMNSTDLEGKNYFVFSQNIYETPTETNGTISVPKHHSFSKFQYFELNGTNHKKPVCRNGLNISARITGTHPISYALMLIFYCTMWFLMIYFRNDQPFKSRFAGPFFASFAVSSNLVIEFIFGILPYEQSSPNYCIIVGFLTYGILQMA